MSTGFSSRRDFLFRSGGGISGLALAYLLDRDGLLAAAGSEACKAPAEGGNPFAVKSPHFAPRARAVISLFMSGGVSQVDTFDPKPALAQVRGTAAGGQGRGGGASGVSRAVDAQPVHVQETRPVRDGRVGAVPACRHARRRDRVPAVGLREVQRSHPGPPGDAVGSDSSRLSGARLVAELRARVRELGAAGLRGPARLPRRPDWRTPGLVLRLPAGRLSRHVVPRQRRSDRGSQAACRRDARSTAGAARHAGEVEPAPSRTAPGELRPGRAHFLV